MDIDPAARPDILGLMTDMSAIPDEAYDAVYSSHSIEHLYPHEVPVALAEFRRVLKPTGFSLITCPDLQSVCALVAQGDLETTAYVSPAGPIAPIDIIYGHRAAMAAGNLFMAHRTGFTAKTLAESLKQAGFAAVAHARRAAPAFDLWAVAFRDVQPEARMREAAAAYFYGGVQT
jgi:predicted SAM-dependent methyltransferase